MENKLTIEQVQQALPKALKYSATEELVNTLNTISDDPAIADTIKNNFIGYGSVLADGKYKMSDYLSAVTYVTYKLMDLSNQQAYSKTFPKRYASLMAKGCTEKDISSYVAMYHKGKLVQSILEQSMIPFWLLNQDARQKALNVQVELMYTAKSAMVRSVAAESILKHTEEPRAAGPTLNVNIGKYTGLDDLEKTMAELARTQKNVIENGSMSTKQIAEQRLVEAEIIND